MTLWKRMVEHNIESIQVCSSMDQRGLRFGMFDMSIGSFRHEIRSRAREQVCYEIAVAKTVYDSLKTAKPRNGYGRETNISDIGNSAKDIDRHSENLVMSISENKQSEKWDTPSQYLVKNSGNDNRSRADRKEFSECLNKNDGSLFNEGKNYTAEDMDKKKNSLISTSNNTGCHTAEVSRSLHPYSVERTELNTFAVKDIKNVIICMKMDTTDSDEAENVCLQENVRRNKDDIVVDGVGLTSCAQSDGKDKQQSASAECPNNGEDLNRSTGLSNVERFDCGGDLSKSESRSKDQDLDKGEYFNSGEDLNSCEYKSNYEDLRSSGKLGIGEDLNNYEYLSKCEDLSNSGKLNNVEDCDNCEDLTTGDVRADRQLLEQKTDEMFLSGTDGTDHCSEHNSHVREEGICKPKSHEEVHVQNQDMNERLGILDNCSVCEKIGGGISKNGSYTNKMKAKSYVNFCNESKCITSLDVDELFTIDMNSEAKSDSGEYMDKQIQFISTQAPDIARREPAVEETEAAQSSAAMDIQHSLIHQSEADKAKITHLDPNHGGQRVSIKSSVADDMHLPIEDLQNYLGHCGTEGVHIPSDRDIRTESRMIQDTGCRESIWKTKSAIQNGVTFLCSAPGQNTLNQNVSSEDITQPGSHRRKRYRLNDLKYKYFDKTLFKNVTNCTRSQQDKKCQSSNMKNLVESDRHRKHKSKSTRSECKTFNSIPKDSVINGDLCINDHQKRECTKRDDAGTVNSTKQASPETITIHSKKWLDSEKVPDKAIENTSERKLKQLTRNPHVQWKRLVDINIESMFGRRVWEVDQAKCRGGAFQVHVTTTANDLHVTNTANDLHVTTTANDLHVTTTANDLHVTNTANDLHVTSKANNLYVMSTANDHVTSTANDPYVTSTANDPYVTSAANDPYVTSTANDPYVTSAANDPYVTSAANDPYITSAANDPYVTSTASYPYETSAASDPYTTSTVNDPYVTSAPKDPYVTSAANDPYVTSTASDPYVTSAAGDPYTTSTVNDPYVTSAPKDPYVTSAAGDPYVTSAASDPYVTSAAGDPYVTSTVNDPYITSAAKDPYVTSAASDPYVTSSASDPYVTSTANDLYVTSAASDPYVTSAVNDPYVTSAAKDPYVTSAASDPYVTSTANDLHVTERSLEETALKTESYAPDAVHVKDAQKGIEQVCFSPIKIENFEDLDIDIKASVSDAVTTNIIIDKFSENDLSSVEFYTPTKTEPKDSMAAINAELVSSLENLESFRFFSHYTESKEENSKCFDFDCKHFSKVRSAHSRSGHKEVGLMSGELTEKEVHQSLNEVDNQNEESVCMEDVQTIEKESDACDETEKVTGTCEITGTCEKDHINDTSKLDMYCQKDFFINTFNNTKSELQSEALFYSHICDQMTFENFSTEDYSVEDNFAFFTDQNLQAISSHCGETDKNSGTNLGDKNINSISEDVKSVYVDGVLPEQSGQHPSNLGAENDSIQISSETDIQRESRLVQDSGCGNDAFLMSSAVYISTLSQDQHVSSHETCVQYKVSHCSSAENIKPGKNRTQEQERKDIKHKNNKKISFVGQQHGMCQTVSTQNIVKSGSHRCKNCINERENCKIVDHTLKCSVAPGVKLRNGKDFCDNVQNSEQPVAETLREQPVAETLREQPVAETLREQPVAETLREQPVAETLREQPVAETLREQPAKDKLTETACDLTSENVSQKALKHLTRNPLAQWQRLVDINIESLFGRRTCAKDGKGSPETYTLNKTDNSFVEKTICTTPECGLVEYDTGNKVSVTKTNGQHKGWMKYFDGFDQLRSEIGTSHLCTSIINDVNDISDDSPSRVSAEVVGKCAFRVTPEHDDKSPTAIPVHDDSHPLVTSEHDDKSPIHDDSHPLVTLVTSEHDDKSPIAVPVHDDSHPLVTLVTSKHADDCPTMVTSEHDDKSLTAIPIHDDSHPLVTSEHDDKSPTAIPVHDSHPLVTLVTSEHDDKSPTAIPVHDSHPLVTLVTSEHDDKSLTAIPVHDDSHPLVTSEHDDKSPTAIPVHDSHLLVMLVTSEHADDCPTMVTSDHVADCPSVTSDHIDDSPPIVTPEHTDDCPSTVVSKRVVNCALTVSSAHNDKASKLTSECVDGCSTATSEKVEPKYTESDNYRYMIHAEAETSCENSDFVNDYFDSGYSEYDVESSVCCHTECESLPEHRFVDLLCKYKEEEHPAMEEISEHEFVRQSVSTLSQESVYVQDIQKTDQETDPCSKVQNAVSMNEMNSFREISKQDVCCETQTVDSTELQSSAFLYPNTHSTTVSASFGRERNLVKIRSEIPTSLSDESMEGCTNCCSEINKVSTTFINYEAPSHTSDSNADVQSPDLNAAFLLVQGEQPLPHLCESNTNKLTSNVKDVQTTDSLIPVCSHRDGFPNRKNNNGSVFSNNESLLSLETLGEYKMYQSVSYENIVKSDRMRVLKFRRKSEQVGSDNISFLDALCVGRIPKNVMISKTLHANDDLNDALSDNLNDDLNDALNDDLNDALNDDLNDGNKSVQCVKQELLESAKIKPGKWRQSQVVCDGNFENSSNKTLRNLSRNSFTQWKSLVDLNIESIVGRENEEVYWKKYERGHFEANCLSTSNDGSAFHCSLEQVTLKVKPSVDNVSIDRTAKSDLKVESSVDNVSIDRTAKSDLKVESSVDNVSIDRTAKSDLKFKSSVNNGSVDRTAKDDLKVESSVDNVSIDRTAKDDLKFKSSVNNVSVDRTTKNNVKVKSSVNNVSVDRTAKNDVKVKSSVNNGSVDRTAKDDLKFKSSVDNVSVERTARNDLALSSQCDISDTKELGSETIMNSSYVVMTNITDNIHINSEGSLLSVNSDHELADVATETCSEIAASHGDHGSSPDHFIPGCPAVDGELSSCSGLEYQSPTNESSSSESDKFIEAIPNSLQISASEVTCQRINEVNISDQTETDNCVTENVNHTGGIIPSISVNCKLTDINTTECVTVYNSEMTDLQGDCSLFDSDEEETSLWVNLGAPDFCEQKSYEEAPYTSDSIDDAQSQDFNAVCLSELSKPILQSPISPAWQEEELFIKRVSERNHLDQTSIFLQDIPSVRQVSEADCKKVTNECEACSTEELTSQVKSHVGNIATQADLPEKSTGNFNVKASLTVAVMGHYMEPVSVSVDGNAEKEEWVSSVVSDLEKEVCVSSVVSDLEKEVCVSSVVSDLEKEVCVSSVVSDLEKEVRVSSVVSDLEKEVCVSSVVSDLEKEVCASAECTHFKTFRTDCVEKSICYGPCSLQKVNEKTEDKTSRSQQVMPVECQWNKSKDKFNLNENDTFCLSGNKDVRHFEGITGQNEVPRSRRSGDLVRSENFITYFDQTSSKLTTGQSEVPKSGDLVRSENLISCFDQTSSKLTTGQSEVSKSDDLVRSENLISYFDQTSSKLTTGQSEVSKSDDLVRSENLISNFDQTSSKLTTKQAQTDSKTKIQTIEVIDELCLSEEVHDKPQDFSWSSLYSFVTRIFKSSPKKELSYQKNSERQKQTKRKKQSKISQANQVNSSLKSKSHNIMKNKCMKNTLQNSQGVNDSESTEGLKDNKSIEMKSLNKAYYEDLFVSTNNEKQLLSVDNRKLLRRKKTSATQGELKTWQENCLLDQTAELELRKPDSQKLDAELDITAAGEYALCQAELNERRCSTMPLPRDMNDDRFLTFSAENKDDIVLAESQHEVKELKTKMVEEFKTEIGCIQTKRSCTDNEKDSTSLQNKHKTHRSRIPVLIYRLSDKTASSVLLESNSRRLGKNTDELKEQGNDFWQRNTSIHELQEDDFMIGSDSQVVQCDSICKNEMKEMILNTDHYLDATTLCEDFMNYEEETDTSFCGTEDMEENRARYGVGCSRVSLSGEGSFGTVHFTDVPNAVKEKQTFDTHSILNEATLSDYFKKTVIEDHEMSANIPVDDCSDKHSQVQTKSVQPLNVLVTLPEGHKPPVLKQLPLDGKAQHVLESDTPQQGTCSLTSGHTEGITVKDENAEMDGSDLLQSSLECLLEMLLQRGKVVCAFVTNTEGEILAQTAKLNVTTRDIRCLMCSLSSCYRGIVNVEIFNDIYMCFKHDKDSSLVGSASTGIFVAHRGKNSIVVGFAKSTTPGSCIKEVQELSCALSQRGL